MKQETISALLGRPLSANETTNFKLYLSIAHENLEELICTSISCDSSDRTYETRKGYSTVFTDIFTDIDSVTINGEVVTDYTVMQFDKFNGSWYNSIVFNDRKCSSEKVVVSANWGFNETPADLQLLIARLFDNVSKTNSEDRRIKSKKIEDFSITYSDIQTMDDLVAGNSKTIAKYSLCDVANIQSGDVCGERVRSFYYN